MAKILSCFAFVLLSASSSYPQWERVVIAWTGKSDPALPVTQGSPHSLQYYLTPSPERDPINSLSLGEKAGTHEISLQDYVVETAKCPVGEAFGRKIIEIVLTFRYRSETQETEAKGATQGNSCKDTPPQSSEEPASIQWRSVVMERSPGAYQELYLLIDVGAFVRHLSYASLLAIEGARILGTAEYYQGNGGMCGQRYWVLDHDGPWLIDFSAVNKEMKKLIPLNATVVPSCPSLANGEFKMSNWIKGDCGACNLGTADVRFRLDGHRAVPVESRFKPEGPPQLK